MATDKQKQNLRYQKAYVRFNKKTYKGLTEDQKKMVKLTEQFNQLDKDLNYFWLTAPRNNNNSVCWDNCSDEQLNYFEHINKLKERTLKSINKLEDLGILQDDTMELFNQINTHSVCF